MSLPHDSAHNHVTGASEYVDDRTILKNELFCDVIYSTRRHAKILNINFSKALKCPGIIAGFTGDDFHHNLWGTIFKDQPILASHVCQYAGEPIALLVGKSLVEVQYAKRLVEISYEDLLSVKSIDEAIDKKSFIASKRFIRRGNFDEAFAKSKHKITGQLRIQGADHFYLESQASIAYPLEDGQIEIHSSSQHPTETQHVVAHALGLPDKDVVCVVKRMGGGFGGKESQAAPFAAMAALCAQKLNAPARLVLTKDDDMIMTGKRNPFQNDYWVGFDDQGVISALKVNLYSDAGAYADLSTSIMERAMLHSDNAYFIPNMDITGQVCKTNHHSHTAFRGFGGPKGVATIERIIEEIAFKLKIDPVDVRIKNCYRDEDGKNITHYGQIFKNNMLPKLFETSLLKTNYYQKRQKLELFNQSQDQYVKGMSLTAVKFGISFTTRFLNQANALVIVHQDGSLQVSTGATEMGQGVNARIAEMVASEIGLTRDKVRLMPTRTDKNANTSPTAASSGTDLNGAAALLATRKIKYRLSSLATKLLTTPKEQWARFTAGLGTAIELEIEQAPFVNDPNEGADWPTGIATYFDIIFSEGEVFDKNNPGHKISFSDLVLEAYLNRVNLSDYAHFKIPGIEFNKLEGKGDAFLYFTQGVALSSVTINRDTGELKIDSTDILMDLGRPVNHDLDIGQISGAFIQGVGWVTTENLFYNDQGLLLSHAPSTYKIPSIQDTPRHYKIELIENDENYMNVRGTKAVGEPPLLLGISVWTAAQNALSYLKNEDESYPCLKIPATNEEILRKLHPEQFAKWDSGK
jgi:xanthine dehydrogenase large subunit